MVRKNGWQQSGQLITKNSKELKMQQTFLDTVQGAGLYTVQFDVARPAAGVSADVTADVFWKVAGNSLKRSLSVGSGTTITGTGEAIEVVMRDTTLVAGVTAGLRYDVSMQVCPGSRPTHSPPFLRGDLSGFTAVAGVPVLLNPYTLLIPVNAGANIPIPQGIGVISTDVSATITNAVGPIILSQLAVTETDSSGAPYSVFHPLIDTGYVPVVPPATTLAIVNIGVPGAQDIVISVLWGIDG